MGRQRAGLHVKVRKDGLVAVRTMVFNVNGAQRPVAATLAIDKDAETAAAKALETGMSMMIVGG